ncbi:hypothetical protein [Methanoplanus limicola]|uniref:Uncharacterized protein n=1 Tax=Methanoplanus limicola DSM 2279 TaxID=937775 RepID=H1Z0E9_9EURY|nr:hypothetical protein [Methanoplanus limicola]EHQ34416.1 hypothetical protein Metlim_0269 [Methanoplanus limicola DSM 2279]
MGLKGIGWIPNLNGDISLSNPFVRKKSLFTEENELINIDLDKLRTGGTDDENFLTLKYPLFETGENSNMPGLFIFSLKNKNQHINSVHIFQNASFTDGNPELLRIATVKVENINPKGLITLKMVYFFLSDDGKNSEIILNIKKTVMGKAFEILREIYHTHTHHTPEMTESSSIMTRLYYVETEKEACERVVQWYLDKIRYYHEWIPDYLKMVGNKLKNEKSIAKNRLKYMSVAEKFIRQAKGEYLYGQNFVTYFYGNDTNESNMLPKIFENAIMSVDILAQELKNIYSNVCVEETLQINESMKRISIYVGIIALLTLLATAATFIVQMEYDSLYSFISASFDTIKGFLA